MIDLVCLAADKNIEAAIAEILQRSSALGIRQIQFEIIVHPNRDPGCFHQSSELLTGYLDRAAHALVVFDRAWEGAPAHTGVELENLLEQSLSAARLGAWARAVVIDPELEAWVFSGSPHVAASLGWRGTTAELREALTAADLWQAERAKPQDPKAAVKWALRKAKKPLSSSVFRELAGNVSLGRCQDRAFVRLRELLGTWFSSESAED